MHAPIMITGDGTRWTQCAKCRKIRALERDELEGHILECADCASQLCLKKMSMVEWEALTEQYPQPLSPVEVRIPAHSNALIISTVSGLRYTQCPKCQARHVLHLGFVHGSHLCCNGCGENLLLQELSMGELENFKGVERDSAEADAAQALFVEFGFSSQWVIAECNPAGWGLVRYADFERWSQKHYAEKLRNWSLEPRRIQPSKMPIWDNCSGDAVLTAREMTKRLQERGFLVRTNVGSQPRVADITGFAAGRRYEYDVDAVGKTAAMFGTEVHQAMDASQRNEKLKQELIRQYTNAAAFKLGRRHVGDEKPIKDQLAQNLKLIGCTYTEIGEVISELVEGLKNV